MILGVVITAVLAFGDSEGTRVRRTVRAPGEVPTITLAVAADHQELARVLLATSAIGGDTASVEPLAVDLNDTGACDAILAAGKIVVLTTLDLDQRELRSCLVEGGGIVVAFDALGDQRPSGRVAGEVVSTRRGYVDNLVDLARWASEADELRGAVGVVGLAPDGDLTEQAVAALEAEGIPVAETALVGPGGLEPDDVAPKLDSAGVSTVLLALPSDLAGEVVAAARDGGPSLGFLSGDAYDMAVAEDLPGAFHGVVLYTSRLGPWATAERPHVDQRRCRVRYQQAGGQDPAALDSSAELALYALCQHLDMVDRAVAAVERGVDMGDALRNQTVRSSLTSFLQSRPGGGFGPSEDAVLRWSAACGCFELERGFAPRPV